MFFRFFLLTTVLLMTVVPAVNAQTQSLSVQSNPADEADTFFDDSYVHEIRLHFDDPNWYNVLYDSHASDPDDPYFPARFEAEGIVLDPVGVRFKGNSSFSIPGVKKSIKIDFDEYDEGNDDLAFYGLKKLNLNNGFKDPTLLREKLFLDFAGIFVPTIRAVHTRVYINDVYWGLYTAVEQVDKTFVQSRFGNDEDGNLFKAQTSDDGNPQGDFGSDLTWLGSDPEPYHDHYQLKTNEEEDDYSQLIEFIDILNNTPAADLPAQIEPVFDVESGLYALALNNLFVNLDAYNASAHNYYLYDRDDSGQFTHIHWDTNEAFGNFLAFVAPGDDPLEMDPFWLPEVMGPPPPPQQQPTQEEQERPLMENLWAVDSYHRTYLRALARMLREGFDVTTMEQRINELADLIRADVYADNNKMYSNSDFETNLTDNIGGPHTIYGLRYFVERRASYLDSRLNDFSSRSDLRLNEFMAINAGTIQDGAGDYDPWLEIYNLGPGRVHVQQVYLTDDPGQPAKWALPVTDVEDGQFLLIWMDGETGEGFDHASFNLQPDGGELYLYKQAGPSTVLIDSTTYPALAADDSFIRLPDGEGGWETTGQPTPGEANLGSTEPVVLYVNEFMADNDNTIADKYGEYDDWLEIYNPGPDSVNLGGMYLTDDLSDPTQFHITDTLTLPAGGFAIFWADDNEVQGDTHTNFKLGASGEEIGLFDSDGVTEIDSIVFGEQTTDVSEGRCPDGGDTWVFFTASTPGASNEPCGASPVISNTGHTPALPTSSDAVTVTATITDDGTLITTTLYYSVTGSGFVAVPMTPLGGDQYTAQIPPQPDGSLVEYYVFAGDNDGYTSTGPSGAPGETYAYIVGYQPPTLYINEFLADNDTVLEDPDEPGEYPDWIEIYNPGPDPVKLGGLCLTDNLSDPAQFRISDTITIPAGGFILFWADNDEEQGPFHTNFKLDADGEEIGLFGAEGTVQIDAVVFTTQTTDVAFGRLPDGTGDWGFMDHPTPGGPNGYYHRVYLPLVVRD